MWPTTDEITDVDEIDATSAESLLANVLKMESLFLVQLAQSSCGLIESLPPSLAQEVFRQVEAGEAGDKRKLFSPS
jgi:pyruvate/2-oxoglutarate/acetoin dehydrogenase E1 component